MTNFFHHQDAARKKSFLLILLFILAVALIVGMVTGAAYWVIWLIKSHANIAVEPEIPTKLLLQVAGTTLAVIVIGTIYRIAQLSSGGGESVASMFDGRYVQRGTAQDAEKVLMNVVDEMSIASGISPPRVYLMDDGSINAFAAGNSVNSAVIGVTRGCLSKLSRQELQGVVAHEFSHILNGDMRTNMHLIGLIFGILMLALTGRVLIRAAARSGGGRNAGQAKLLFFGAGLALLVIGYIGVLFGRIMQAAISRQREFLADATAVQFTRYPDGIFGALKKIGQSGGSQITSPEAEGVAHMFFGSPLGFSGWFSGLLASHPPIHERLARISPMRAKMEKTDARHIPVEAQQRPLSQPSLVAQLDSAGSVQPEAVAEARTWLEDLPSSISRSLATPQGSASMALALLVANMIDYNREQLELPKELRLDPSAPLPDSLLSGMREETWQMAVDMYPRISDLTHSEQLKLAELALSGISGLPEEERRRMAEHVEKCQAYNRTDSLSAYMVSSFIRARLTASNAKYSGSTAHSAAVVLSTLAWKGAKDGNAPRPAYVAASNVLPLKPMITEHECTMPNFDAALFQLRSEPERYRNTFLKACAECIQFDREITDSETCLFRAISSVLDCPIPMPLPMGLNS